jgi:hypothetical protein
MIVMLYIEHTYCVSYQDLGQFAESGRRLVRIALYLARCVTITSKFSQNLFK